MDEQERTELFESTNLAGAATQQANQAATTQYYLEEQNKNLAETQLEVESITLKAYHLLRQDKYVLNDKEVFEWKEVELNERVLTDEGVDKFMKKIHFYVNKSNLLSNFDENQINSLMYNFCNEFNDLMYLKYEVLFNKPTFEDCRTILKARIQEQAKIKSFAKEILGQKQTPEQIKKIEEELLKDTEKRIEYELKKIRDEKTRENIREYCSIFDEIHVLVFGALNRAWKGEERGSIRRHTNISEIIGGRPMMTKADKAGGFFPWGR